MSAPNGKARVRRVVAIVNPATRRDPAAILAALDAARRPGLEIDVRYTPGPGTTIETARAARAGADLLIAVGGDGTVGEVATALRGSPIPLAIIPAGSTNIVARELGIPLGPRSAVHLALGEHRLARIDMGRSGDRSFLHMAGAGLDSRLFAAADADLKRRFGWLAYLPAGGRNLGAPPTRFAVVADDDRFEVVSPLVLVANGGSVINPRLRLYPGLRSDDGWLDVLVFTATRPAAIARTLGRVATRHLERSPFVVHRRARRVELTADPPIPYQLDGDVVGPTPATFSVDAAALSVVVPLGGNRTARRTLT